MARDLLLMCRDIAVMSINFDEAKYDVVNEKLLPWEMKGRMQRIPDFSEIKTKYDDTRRQIAINKNRDAFISFLSRRVLPLSRDNAKKLYQLFGYSQLQDAVSKSKIAITCRAVSLQDDYWVRLDGDQVTWKDVELRHNSLSEVVAQISLHGTSLTLQGELRTPEWTGSGAYAKAWRRIDDKLVLLKAGAKDSTESRIEVMTSNLLDKMNVDHVKYWLIEDKGVKVCACECMTTDELSILPAENFSTYCNANGLDFFKEVDKLDKNNIRKMWIVDYLISNRDRHTMNWGFFYNSSTMEVLGCHPLFDHNNAFDKDYIDNPDMKYLFNQEMTMRQAAKKAIQEVDFHFTAPITREDFITDRQYNSFMSRAKELGIKTVEDLRDIGRRVLGL